MLNKLSQLTLFGLKRIKRERDVFFGLGQKQYAVRAKCRCLVILLILTQCFPAGGVAFRLIPTSSSASNVTVFLHCFRFHLHFTEPAIMATVASSSAVLRPATQKLAVRRPAAARSAPKALRCLAQNEQRQQVALSSSCISKYIK